MDVSGKIIDHTITQLAAHQRLIAHRGGTRSGKTYSILICLMFVAMRRKKSIDIISESLPHLKRGAIHDFEELLDKNEIPCEINKTDRTYTFENGSVVRFFSADDWGKVKGSRRDILFINEANRIDFETYRQLSVRTTQSTIIDWNPDCEFWYERNGLHEKYPPLVSTYKDNPHLDAAQVAEIESNKGDANWWNVYGLGQIGKVESVIFKNWDIVQDIPGEARIIGYGLDFGFMADPTAIVAIYNLHGVLYLDEICYAKGLTNDKIAAILKQQAPVPIVADSAEQKSIQEIYNFGVRTIEPAVKGKDSIKNGIDVMHRYEMRVTNRSLNLIDELRSYKWKTDKITGEILNEPIDKYNHAIDAVRYFVGNKLNNQPRTQGIKRISIK